MDGTYVFILPVPYTTELDKYEGESNENLKSAIKIQTTAPLSCKFQQ